MVFYSKVLMEFIEPLLSGTENAEEFLVKAKIGQMIWNYTISDSYNLSLDADMKKALKKLLSIHPEMIETMNMLVVRKAMLFQDYNHFIFTVENRYKPDGTANLYVESAPADKMLKR